MFFSHFGKNLYDFSVQIATSHGCRSTAGLFAFVTTCYFLSRLRYPDVIIFIFIIFLNFLLSPLCLTSLSVLLCSLGKLFFTCDECRFLIGHDVGAA